MLVLNPVSNSKIWGTSRIHKYGGDKSIERVGSVYSASAIESISSPINDNDFLEKDFYSAVKNNPEKFGVKKGTKEFPLIVSFTGADLDLSIQVHPTDDFARQNEDKVTGKSESWYFIEEPKEGWIYAESRLSNKEDILNKMKEGKFDEVIEKRTVRKGDLVYIESGTLHALTKGSLVYEIQQSTDITYRFYDFDRVDAEGNRRDLHLDKAIATLKPSNKITSKPFSLGEISREKEYSLKLTSLNEEYINEYSIAQIITVIEGEFVINNIKIELGKSVIVFPGEKIKIQEKKGKVIVATPLI